MKWILALIICISLNSCYVLPSMHYSVAQNVPLFTQKNEARLSVATGTEAIGVQGAYAFSNSFAVLASYYGGLDEFPAALFADDGSNIGTRQSGEFALGYFKPIGRHSIIEVYAGVERYYRAFSWYSEAYLFPVQTGSFSAYCTKPFVQVDLGLHNTGHHSLGLSMKIGMLKYDHFYYVITDTTGRLVQRASDLNFSPALIVEPCFTYRLGNKWLNFQAQAGLSLTTSLVNNIYFGPGLSEAFFFSAGLSMKMFMERTDQIKQVE